MSYTNQPQQPRGTLPTSPPRLLDQVRDVIRRKHFSLCTEQSYVHWIKRFILFHGKRHPRDMGPAEVTAFLNYLARERRVAFSTGSDQAKPLLS